MRHAPLTLAVVLAIVALLPRGHAAPTTCLDVVELDYRDQHQAGRVARRVR